VGAHSIGEGISPCPSDLYVPLCPALADEVVLIFLYFLVDVGDVSVEVHNLVKKVLNFVPLGS
jgi:hypothetical protein